MVLKKVNSYRQKNETGLLPYSIYKSKLKNELKYINESTDTIQFLKAHSMLFGIGLSDVYLDMSPQARSNKNEQMGPNQIKELLHSKGNIQ